MLGVKNVRFTCVSLLTTLTFFVTACGKSSNLSEAEHLERAKAFQADGKTQSLVIELKNILQKNPNHPEAHWLLGDVYSSLGFGKDAEKELLRAQELGIDPEVIKAPLGKALLDQKMYKRVLNEIQPGPKSAAKNIAAIKTLYAQAEIGLKHFEKGCELFRDAKLSDATYVPAYWGISQCSSGYGKPIEAGDELDKAIEIDPKNVETWLLRGDLWRNQKQLNEAEKAYTTGLSHRPEHVASLIARASVRIPLNNNAGALEDLGAADKIVKDHPLALYFRGVMHFKVKKYKEAKAAFEAVLRTSPGYLPAVLWMGMADYALNNLEQASHAFAQYTSAVPNSTEAQSLLAITRARLGGKVAARETLAALDKIDINDAQTLTLIGQAHLLTGDDQASARYLTRAIEKQPEATDPRVSLVAALLQRGDAPGAVRQAEEMFKKTPSDVRAAAVLIGALLQNQQSDRAFEIVKQLEQQMPKSVIPPIYRAAIKAKLDDLDGAKVELEKAYKLQPNHVLIGHSLAAIAIKHNKLDEARRYYQQVREKNAEPFETLMAMYDLEVLAIQPDAARKLVEVAAAKYPKAARSATIVAAAYIRAGQPDKALAVSSAAADANPNDIDLLTARGSAFFDKGEITNALVSFNRVVKLRPDFVDGYINLALIHNATGNFATSRNNLQQVLKIDSKNRRARLMLAGLNIRDKKYDEALKLAHGVEQEDPTLAEAYVLQSTTLTVLKRQAEALAALVRAQKAMPDSAIPVIEIAKLQFHEGRHDEGLKTIKSWLQVHADNLPATAFLAESLMIQNKKDEAIAVYERILKLSPEHPIALNNLANIFITRDPSLALRYAKRAYQRAPGDVAVMDTYGWLLLKTGDSKQALGLLRTAFAAAPYATEVHFHLAAAMVENGEKAQARKELEKLLSNQREFPVKQDAQALLSTL